MNYIYVNPLCTRYASHEMQEIFSNDHKFRTWRKLWISLAKAEKTLGLPITDEQIVELMANANSINYECAEQKEREVRHDVMSHIYAYGVQCPHAKGIIHLGATSCYVGDNTDIIVMREGLLVLRKLLINLIAELAEFAAKHKNQPTLAFTHFQAAQPTTVGKRATLWLNDILLDLEQTDFVLGKLAFFGCKGTTGTAASFLELFDGDANKVIQLETIIATEMGFDLICPVSGQTYSRKLDYLVVSLLSSIAQSAAKFSNDIRLLSHLKEFDEPFEDNQIGSSAMAYKRNPMRSERIAALARYVIVDALNPAITAASQWFERTLDDSANKRISVPEAFLAVDGILSLYINIVSKGRVYPKMAERHLNEEMPFMATENILMHCVKKGGDRQQLHEKIRQHSVAAATKIKLEGGDNDLLDRILADAEFALTVDELTNIMHVENFIGCAPKQTEDYLANYIRPILQENKTLLGIARDIDV